MTQKETRKWGGGGGKERRYESMSLSQERGTDANEKISPPRLSPIWTEK